MFLKTIFSHIKDYFLGCAFDEFIKNVIATIEIRRLKKKSKETFPKYADQIEAILDGLDLKQAFHEQQNDFFRQLREKLEEQCEECELDPNIRGRFVRYMLVEINSMLLKRYKDWYERANLQQQMEQEMNQLRNDYEALRDDVAQLRQDISNGNQLQEILLHGSRSIDPGIEHFRKNNWSGRKQDLEMLYQLFFGDNKRGLVFLHGQPGMGKTVLAKLFFEYLKEREPKDQSQEPWQVYMISGQGKLSHCIPSLAGVVGSEKYSADQVLDELRKPKYSRTLLIIDNYECEKYNMSIDENITESRLLNRLLNDCQAKVLITTRAEHRNGLMGTCGLKAVSNPSQLFYNRAGKTFVKKLKSKGVKEQKKTKEEIQELIKLVYGNTLLIVLCAHLLAESDITVEEVLKSLRTRTMGDITTEVPVEVDRIPLTQDEETIYKQVRAIFDLSSIMKNENERKVMANAAILPLQGMETKTFLEMVGCDEKAVEGLMKSAWLINTDSKERIAMHPMISEVVQRWQDECKNIIVNYDACKEYCQAVCDKLSLKEDSALRFPWRIYADEIYRVFSNEKNDVLLHLWYRMSDIYDKRGEWDVSAGLVGRVLDEMEQENVPDEKILDRSRMYAGCGYSMVNYAKPEEDKPIMDSLNLQRGFAALKKSEELLKNYSNQTSAEYRQVYALLLSNWGACYLKLARYQKDDEKKDSLYFALQFHGKALKKRQELVDQADVSGNDVRSYKKELANSLTTVGTDLFYMGDYQKSARYHRKALEIRREVDDRENIYVSEQRITGNIIRLLRKYTEEPADPKGINPEDRTQLEEALGFYPELIRENILYEKVNALISDLSNLRELYVITKNLPEETDLMKMAEEKKVAVQKMIEMNNTMKDVLEKCSEQVAEFFR